MQDNNKIKGTHNPINNTNDFKDEYKHVGGNIVSIKVEKIENMVGIRYEKSTNEGEDQGGWTTVGKKAKQSKLKKVAHKRANDPKYKAITQSPVKTASPKISTMNTVKEGESETDLETMDIYGVDSDDSDKMEEEEVVGSMEREEEGEDDKLPSEEETNENKMNTDEQTNESHGEKKNWEELSEDEEEDFKGIKLIKKPPTGEKRAKKQLPFTFQNIDKPTAQLKKPEISDENKIENEKEDKEKINKESSLTKEANKGNIKTYAESIKEGIKPKEAKFTIRVRCTIGLKTDKAELEIMKSTLTTALGLAKDIDPDAELMTLGAEVGNLKDAIDINKLDRINIKNYIDWRVDREGDKRPKFHQKKIGIRITSNTNPKVFIWKWQSLRKVCKEQKRDHFAIRMDKVQNSTRAFQVGMFMGTSSKQNIERLQLEMEQATGIKGIEVSYQDIFQIGVTESFWQKMYEKTDIYDRNTPAWYEAFHKNAPRAICVYVQEQNQVAAARSILAEKFQRETNGQWPRLPDGSVAKFVPLMGTKFSPKTQEKVIEKLQTHIEINDQLVEIPIEVSELDVKYPEMENKSIRDILQGLTAEKVKDNEDKCVNEPLIRHVCDEWTTDQRRRRYSVAVFHMVAQEAETVLNHLEDTLQMRFPQAASIIRRVFYRRSEVKNNPQKFPIQQSTNDEKWFENDSEERYQKVQIEGLELIRKEDLPSNRTNKGASTIGADDFPTDATLETIQSSDKTVDTKAGESEEVKTFATKHKIKVETVRRSLGKVKAKLKYTNEFKDRLDDLEKILNMQNKEYEDILGSSPIYWSSTTIADQILGKFRKDLGLDPGEESQ